VVYKQLKIILLEVGMIMDINQLLQNTLGGIGDLVLGSFNPVLGGLNYVRKNIGPEFDRFRQAPTLDRYLNPDKYKDKPYIIGTNPMDYQRFNPDQFGQEYKYKDGNCFYRNAKKYDGIKNQ
jgi:hypothetical protein